MPVGCGSWVWGVGSRESELGCVVSELLVLFSARLRGNRRSGEGCHPGPPTQVTRTVLKPPAKVRWLAGRFVRSTLECGGKATALGGWWNHDDSQSVMLAQLSRWSSSPSLPKRWLGRHRTPKLREICPESCKHYPGVLPPPPPATTVCSRASSAGSCRACCAASQTR